MAFVTIFSQEKAFLLLYIKFLRKKYNGFCNYIFSGKSILALVHKVPREKVYWLL